MEKLKIKYVCLILAVILLAGCGDKKKKPPSPDIVATYQNGEISIADVEKYFQQRIDGLKVLVGDSLAAIKDQIPQDKEMYRAIIRDMVLDEMVKRTIREKQLNNRENISHALEHIEEELTLDQLHSEMHEKDRIPVSEIDIQKYYDENRQQFGDKPLYDVRDQIKTILESRNESDYVENYLRQLKESATITKNYELLRVPEPTEQELQAYYEKNKETYKQPAQWILDQIEIADTTGQAQQLARKAWTRLGAGENFALVAEAFGKDSSFTTFDYSSGARSEAFDNAVTALNPGEYSKPIAENGKYYIVRLKEKTPASYLPFEQVRGVIRRLLMDEREKKIYEQNNNQTLFTIHGRRFTLGDFFQEYQELSPSEQEKYRTYEQRVQMVDRMIERLLLLEDSYDRMLNAKTKDEVEHVREDILKQTLHREEVDQKVEVTDEEVKEFYEQNKERFKTPPRAKISIIVVRRGQDETAGQKSKEKIDEAYDKLKGGFFTKGMSFEEAAKKYSEDTQTAENGGRLEKSNNSMVEMFNHEFHEKFMDLDEGEITEPFTMGSDYLIVKMREKQQPKQLSFEAVKAHLKEDLKLKKHDELMAQMYQKMLNQANLVIYDQVLENLVNSKKEVNNLP